MQIATNTLGKILVVDDEPRNVNILLELLDEYQVEKAKNGEQALNKLDSFEPDVVLLDIMMPGLNGYEVCQRIKSSQKQKFVKVLLVSGKSMLEERLEGYRAGADDYITKPFDLDEMLAKVRVFMRLKTIEEVESLQKNFLQLLAHEALTPLNGILGFTNLILNSKEHDLQETLDFVNEIQKCGIHFSSMVEAVILLCNLKTSSKIALEACSACSIVEEALVKLRKSIEQAHLKKSVELEDQKIMVDESLTRQAIIYIINKLIQHGSESEELLIKGKSYDGLYQLKLSTSYFIDAKELEKDFAGFTSDDIMHHSGIGDLRLSVAKQVIERQGGACKISSHQEQGTTIIIDLPIEDK